MKKNVKNNVIRIVLSVLILALIPVMHLLGAVVRLVIMQPHLNSCIVL